MGRGVNELRMCVAVAWGQAGYYQQSTAGMRSAAAATVPVSMWTLEADGLRGWSRKPPRPFPSGPPMLPYLNIPPLPCPIVSPQCAS